MSCHSVYPLTPYSPSKTGSKVSEIQILGYKAFNSHNLLNKYGKIANRCKTQDQRFFRNNLVLATFWVKGDIILRSHTSLRTLK